METKVCSKCHIEKPITQFYKHGFNARGEQTYRSDCKQCQREYDLTRLHKQAEFINAQKHECAKCGENDKTKLHFHHIDPRQKEFTIGKMRNYPLEKVQREIDKCIVLCAHCHKTFHNLNQFQGISLEEYLKL